MRTTILSATALILWSNVASGQPPKVERKGETPAKVTIEGTINIDRAMSNIRLREAVDYFVDKHRIAITIDAAGGEKGRPLDDRRIKIAKMRAAPVGFLVECMAQAAGATSRKARDKFVIEAGTPKDLASLLRPPSPKAIAKAAEIVKIDRPITNLPLKELLDFIAEKHDVCIYLDEAGFQRVKKEESVGERPIFIPAQVDTVE